ncbi:MAG TPA: hypothetical protein VEI49_09565, partial [Terriglobales bacterium]|nr:hypothetical protein [Terriglobales bacterium]
DQWCERTCEQLPPDLSELVQHEIDHLDGILMLARAWGADAIRPVAEHARLIIANRPNRQSLLAQFERASGSAV